MSAESGKWSKSHNEQPEDDLLPKETHCDFLRRLLSKSEGIEEWNKFRRENPSSEIFLGGCDLLGAELDGINLSETNLSGARLWNANLRNARLVRSNLQGAGLSIANLRNANLGGTNSEKASFEEADLQGVNLGEANLKKAKLVRANLSDSNVFLADLEDAKLIEADLRGARIVRSNLRGADLSRSIVDGLTLLWDCDVDCNTKFEGVGLGNMRIYPETRSLLEYNIRRMNWQEWYRGKSKNKWIIKGHQLLTSPIRLFWWISNYGLSTWRIIQTFIVLSVVFATIYFVWGAVDYYCLGITNQPGIVNDLFIPIASENTLSEVYYGAMIYMRSVYFSVVTMTTLGFGDMYANTTRCGVRWWLGHILLVFHVILGYVLLGALVTRFAVLFTSGGPVSKFSKKTKISTR